MGSWQSPRDGILEGGRHRSATPWSSILPLPDAFVRFDDVLRAEGYANLLGRPLIDKRLKSPPFHVPANQPSMLDSHPGFLHCGEDRASDSKGGGFSVLASQCFPLLLGEYSQEKAALIAGLRAASVSDSETVRDAILTAVAASENLSSGTCTPSSTPVSPGASGCSGDAGSSRRRSSSVPQGMRTPVKSGNNPDSPLCSSTSSTRAGTDLSGSGRSTCRPRRVGRSASLGGTPSASRQRQQANASRRPESLEWLRRELWKADRRLAWKG